MQLGIRVCGHMALTNIHSSDPSELVMALHNDSTINIVVAVVVVVVVVVYFLPKAKGRFS